MDAHFAVSFQIRHLGDTGQQGQEVVRAALTTHDPTHGVERFDRGDGHS